MIRLRRSPAALALLLALSLVACSGEADLLRTAAEKVRTIRSGVLSISFTMGDTVTGGEVGFLLQGPFSFDEGGDLPLADLSYTQTKGPDEESYGFVADGKDAYVIVDGVVYLLTEEQQAAFSGFVAVSDEEGAIPGLDLDGWVRDPVVTGEGTVGDDGTVVIEGEVRVPEAFAGLAQLIEALGASGELPFGPEDRERLERAVRDASILVEIGDEDDLLRRLSLDVSLGPPDEGLRDVAGARITFLVEIEDPNEPIEVQTPPNALPLSELELGEA